MQGLFYIWGSERVKEVVYKIDSRKGSWYTEILIRYRQFTRRICDSCSIHSKIKVHAGERRRNDSKMAYAFAKGPGRL